MSKCARIFSNCILQLNVTEKETFVVFSEVWG